MPTLHWIGKEKVVSHHHDVPFKILNHKYTFGKPAETPEPLSENKIIHGDNLEALKALLPQYEGKVNCIYIDPPYNTGNEGWVYNDNVSDPRLKRWLGQVVGKESEDLSRHDKWLCMMYPRLVLLHKLLAKDGAIFISIDDNEQINLKAICDEIWGVRNFQGVFTINTTPNARDYGHIGKMHEYCLFYAKNENSLTTSLLQDEYKQFRYKDNDGGFNIHPLYNSNVAFTSTNRPNLYYPFYLNPESKNHNGFFEIGLSKQEGYIEIFPPKSQKDNVQFVWRWGLQKSNENLNKEVIGYQTGEGEYRIVQKMRTASKVIRSLLLEKDYTSRRGTAELEEIFGKKSFSFPKPIELIKQFLTVATSPHSIILDSFAGSGTTAHAVLNLNKQDGGNRKFILIEMEDYAESITAERVKRVMNGYAGKDGTGGNFNYYELGEPLFKGENGEYLNEAVGADKIRNYIWYSETRSTLTCNCENDQPFLGIYNHTAYYFFYHPQYLTSLDFDTLSIINQRAGQYIIYADNCLIPKDALFKYNIVFKKIPRDISRF